MKDCCLFAASVFFPSLAAIPLRELSLEPVALTVVFFVTDVSFFGLVWKLRALAVSLSFEDPLINFIA